MDPQRTNRGVTSIPFSVKDTKGRKKRRKRFNFLQLTLTNDAGAALLLLQRRDKSELLLVLSAEKNKNVMRPSLFSEGSTRKRESSPGSSSQEES